MAGASGGLAQNVLGAALEFFPIGEEQYRIEVALYGAFVAERLPAGVKRDAPVEANDFGSGLLHRGKKGRAVGAEIDDGHSGLFLADLLQAFDEVGHVRQSVAAVVFDAQAAHPAVENLDGVGSGAHLLGGILGGHGDQLLHQFVPGGGLGVHHFFGVDVVAGASAFDHVAGEGEGRAAESDDGKFVAEMLDHELDGFRHVAEIGGAVGAEAGDVFGSADGLFDLWAFAGGEMKGQAHDFERQEKVGEDDGGIDLEDFGGFNGDLGRDFGLFADLDQGILLADGTVLGHVASGLTHEPDGGAFGGLSFGGANKERVGG